MAPQLSAGDRLGDYVIDSRIGKGKAGSVYLGRTANELGKEFAIKYPASGREIVTLKKLDGCLGIPKLFASGVHDDTLWMAMELLGPPLTGSIQTLWCCTSTEQRWQGACIIGRMLLRRILAIHNRGYIHGDIKPDNILVACKSGGATEGVPVNQLFFVDFGLTREQTDDTSLEGHIGTIEYSSINSMGGAPRVRLDDVEALGWLLLHLMTGDLPWFEWIQDVDWNDKPARSELVQRVRQTKIDLLGNGPESFENRYRHMPAVLVEYLRVCYRSLGKNPAAVKPDYHTLARLLGCWTIHSEEDDTEDLAVFNRFYVGGNLALPMYAPSAGETFFVTSNWNKWSFEEMKRHPLMPDIYSIELLLPREDSEFQIVCNRDRSKVFHPAVKRAGLQDTKVIGPSSSKTAHGFNWSVGSKAGTVIEIEFQRAPDKAMGLSRVSWKEVRHESVQIASMAKWLYTKYFLVGTWDKWVGKREMTWNGKNFSICVQMGHKLLESFQILEDGDWNRKLHPNVKRASPHVPHSLVGPEKDGHGRNWTIGAHPDDKAAFGAQYVIRLEVGVGGPKTVDWKRL
uniref:Casein kinase I n=1 Tax=Alexandrium catenella TaxID=2925 RepID=A0A7S1RJZ3_ALECA|mmetsp:Transcript_60886/g.163004  ORF Transcript_60886/g.163004 Transcript_60886/m.163004 type:complete len:570 (+) Transcript_60886:150-1859(+)